MNNVIQKATVEYTVPVLVARSYDAERILPMSLIREHTKTDDVMTVSDQQLQLYRASALEAAEQYTGIPLKSRRVITEVIKLPKRKAYQFYQVSSNYFTHQIRGIFAEPFVYFFGGRSMYPQTIRVTVHSREVRLEVPIDFGLGCCNPCSEDDSPRIQYVSGYDCEDNMPVAIIHGALKYIAHSVENAGDRVEKLGGTLTGREVSPALASGAIEIWRSAMPGAI